jgi:hypothetical protein
MGLIKNERCVATNVPQEELTRLTQVGLMLKLTSKGVDMKMQLMIAMLVAAGLAAAPYAADAKHKAKHHSSQSHTMKDTGANPSSQGNVGPGTNQAGSMKSSGNTK